MNFSPSEHRVKIIDESVHQGKGTTIDPSVLFGFSIGNPELVHPAPQGAGLRPEEPGRSALSPIPF